MKSKKRQYESANDKPTQVDDRRLINPAAAYISAQRSAIAVYVALALLVVTGWLAHTLFFQSPVTDYTEIAILVLYIPFLVFGMLYTLSLNLQPVHFRFMVER